MPVLSDTLQYHDGIVRKLNALADQKKKARGGARFKSQPAVAKWVTPLPATADVADFRGLGVDYARRGHGVRHRLLTNVGRQPARLRRR